MMASLPSAVWVWRLESASSLMKVLMPMTSPFSLTSGPPLLPCETTAECTMLRGEVWRMALTTPSVNTTSGTALKSPLRSRR